MRVLVTGGTGFIGSRLSLRYLQSGSSVRVLGQVNTEAESANRLLLSDQGAEVVVGTITDLTLVNRAVQGVDVVHHLAATQHEMNVPDEHYRAVNVGGTKHVLEASIRAGVSRFLYGSTIGVYGSVDGIVDESSPCNPDNVYGRTKLEAERVVMDLGGQVPVVVRIPETYGPGDQRLLKLFRTIKHRRFCHIGRGQNLHHPVFIEDLLDGLVLATESSSAMGEVIGLAGPRPVTTNEMVHSVAEALKAKPPRARLPLLPFALLAPVVELGLRPLGIQPPLHRRRLDFFRKSFVISVDKARELIGYSPRIDFPEGVRQTARWYESEGWL